MCYTDFLSFTCSKFFTNQYFCYHGDEHSLLTVELILAIFIQYKLQCALNYITTIVLIHKTTSEQKPSTSLRLEKSFRGQKKVSLVLVCSLWLHPYWPSLFQIIGASQLPHLVLSLLHLPPGRFARREVSIGVLVAVLSVDSQSILVQA